MTQTATGKSYLISAHRHARPRNPELAMCLTAPAAPQSLPIVPCAAATPARIPSRRIMTQPSA
eukprot:2916038-Pyramimonas_sp.AAC.1